MTIKHACLIAAASLLTAPIHASAAPVKPGALRDWPRIQSAVKPDAAIEAQVKKIVAAMTLRQKIGQMTQAELKSVTPADVRDYYLGSVLNGGGSWPNNNKHASPADWVALADQFYEAAMSTDMAIKVPPVWGIDAMHGNSNVYGATLFPHNIGLGAAHNAKLAFALGEATARGVRGTGLNWVFAPTLAVVRDDRWGRTYESFSEDPALVHSYAGQFVRGMQGKLTGEGNTIATAKHFIGDGGTFEGKDQGETRATLEQLINIHGAGYYSALEAGAQTVMASFNSYTQSSYADSTSGQAYGKMHGNRELLTVALKDKMGFDGFIVTDWNGHGQVPGCSNDSCAQAINAGIDMVMVPNDWKAFIANTIKQVEDGAIPMARIDDAVSRIVRVKLRAGLFGKKPSASRYAGKLESLQARESARDAVRQSLVLLKNDVVGGAGGKRALPLVRGQKVLVVGKGADSMMHQTGGWTLSWQGNDNTNADFPNGDTILAGIRALAGAGNVTFSADAQDVDASQFDVVVAVLAEVPYAEGFGDIGPSGTLRHSSRYPEDLAVLQKVAGKGKPVVTVLLSGRPVWANDLLNLSDSFVAAWLPGTEGKGVADVLYKAADFRGTLSFSWPKTVCQAAVNIGDKDYAPLFKLGYGLRHASASSVGKLDESFPAGGCGNSNAFSVFDQSDRASFPLYVTSGGERVALGADLNRVFKLSTVTVETAQVNVQQDAKRLTWTGPARFEAHGAKAVALPGFALADGALQFDTVVATAPQGLVTVSMGTASVDLAPVFARLAGKGRQTVRIPLACFSAKGADLTRLDTPFAVSADAPFAAAFTNIQVVGGAAREADAVKCAELK
ncbi:MAG: glycoside hydrolase family 3 N-terminal domain-containing protein [Gammaproteobacteria bacterium]